MLMFMRSSQASRQNQHISRSALPHDHLADLLFLLRIVPAELEAYRSSSDHVLNGPLRTIDALNGPS
jgi:hypothetical protein